MFGRSGPLYHLDPGGARPKRLTLPKRLWSVTSLAASPDGRLIALSNGGGEFPPRNLYVMRADGAGLRQITHGNFSEIDPSWSPDSRWIVFSSTRCCTTATSSGDYALYAIRPDGTGLHQLRRDSGTDDIGPVWSPDGTRIAYVHQPNGGTGWGIWVMNADGTGARPLTHDRRFDDAVAWSPTGHQLAYTSHLIDDRDWQVRVVGADGGRQRALFTCTAPCRNGGYTIAWSPDGRRIAFTVITQLAVPHERPRLALVSAIGGDFRLVATQGTGACCLSWVARPRS